MSDELSDLVARCQQGDTAAFADLVTETQSSIYNLAHSILGNQQEAEDMTQEVYLRAWRALPRFRAESKVTTWLYRIALNTCLNRRRRLGPRLRIIDQEDALEGLALSVDSSADPVVTSLRRETRESLWAAVERLPAKYRLVIVLFYQEQLSYQEIVDLLSIPLGTVKSHLNRARRALAKSLQRKEYSP